MPEDHSTCWHRSKASAMLSGAAYARSRRITFVRNALTRKTSAAPQRVPLQNRGPPTMNAEEIPNWVPATVKKLAVKFRFAEELARRLVTDPKMKSVWQYLLRRAQPVDSEIELKIVPEIFLGPSEMSVSGQEHACALFFLNVVIEMCVPRATTTRQDIENSVAPWRSAAEQCRSAIGCVSSSANSDLVKALSLTAEYFEFRAQVALQDAHSPYTLKRRSGKPEDNSVRGRVRALAAITYPLYGSFQYGVLASVATVALQTNVTPKSVRNWCSDLRDSTAR